MSEQLEEVKIEDFSKITMERLPHLKIEDTLIKIGGGGVEGVSFKKESMKAAGWKYHELTSYNAHPEEACSAFNRLRVIIAEVSEKDQIIALSLEAAKE